MQITPGRLFYKRKKTYENIPKFTMVRLLKIDIELDHLSMYKQWIYTYYVFYKNILKFNFLMGGIKHIDCFHRFMKRSFIHVKNNEVS